MKILKIVGCLVGLAVLAAGGYIVWMIGPRNIIGMLRYDTRREGELKVGDAAPDVPLLSLDGAEERLAGRIGDVPTVLIFGSFT
ncbi:MAG: hypothetical protein JNJ88_06970 [Planctomycetes bacterium]|nr:hypothetical protein [Planctomycetota bacterium]